MTKEKLLEIEPSFYSIFIKAKRFQNSDIEQKFLAYERAKDEAKKLGTFRSEEWDCFIASLADILEL